MINCYTLKVQDICGSTYTNSDGVLLNNAVVKLLSTYETVILSFHNVSSVSTSFLNSSFGEIANEKGLDIIKQRIKITDCTSSVISMLKLYVRSLEYELTT